MGRYTIKQRIVRPHGIHAVHKCGQLLQMSHVSWSVCLSISVLVTQTNCAENAEPIQMPFVELTHVGPRNHVFGKSQERVFFLGGMGNGQ